MSEARVEVEVGISQRPVKRILHEHHFYGYLQRRIEFSTLAQLRMQENPLLFTSVLFTDEVTFHSTGCLKKQNFHFYCVENPRIMRQLDNQHR